MLFSQRNVLAVGDSRKWGRDWEVLPNGIADYAFGCLLVRAFWRWHAILDCKSSKEPFQFFAI